MKDTKSVLEADLSYAVRVVRSGFTAQEAAQLCGVPLPQLQAQLQSIAGAMPKS